jgi:prophage regulatory protein
MRVSSQQEASSTERLLPARDVYEDRLRVSKSTFYGLIRSGEFPKPVRISKQRVGWREAAVNEWVRTRSVAREA